MKAGIIGLPRVGKTTIFSLLTKTHVDPLKYSTTPNVGIATVPDPRLYELAKIYSPKKITPAVIEYVDVAGIAKGEAAKESAYLNAVRTVDMLVHVVRDFKNDTIPHESGAIDPRKDIETLEFELILSDLAVIEKRLERLVKDLRKVKSKDYEIEYELLKRLKAALETEQPLRTLKLSEDEERRVKGFTFLSAKPVLYAVNLGENEISKMRNLAEECGLRKFEGMPNTTMVGLSARIERELAELPPDESEAFLKELGFQETAIDRLITETYRLLNLMTFLTAGEPEVRAWSVKRNSTAPKAAAAIHSDFERGFIRAEVVKYNDLITLRTTAACRDKGLLRLEGKEYIVQEGDVILFRFNV
ncbi:MAG: redox-regulated ATPase YchF [Acidobacteria bacterium]|nr:redox-regulated ATPase YchF [Acidobacteriota bacterium]MBI3656294.1 redox-regulated ATPase YchF [Acidobacteriota bacterium]